MICRGSDQVRTPYSRGTSYPRSQGSSPGTGRNPGCPLHRPRLDTTLLHSRWSRHGNWVMISHGDVVAREYGIPAVVGVAGATTDIITSQRITVDSSAGTITLE